MWSCQEQIQKLPEGAHSEKSKPLTRLNQSSAQMPLSEQSQKGLAAQRKHSTQGSLQKGNSVSANGTCLYPV